MKIAFLGPEGSYSHLAAKLFLKEEGGKVKKPNEWDECVPFRNFSEVLAQAEWTQRQFPLKTVYKAAFRRTWIYYKTRKICTQPRK